MHNAFRASGTRLRRAVCGTVAALWLLCNGGPVLAQQADVGSSSPGRTTPAAPPDSGTPGGPSSPERPPTDGNAASAPASGEAVATSGADVAGTRGARLDFRELARAGGIIGAIIAGLSVAMVALIVEHFFSIRRKALMPNGLAEALHQQISAGRFLEARQQCKSRPSFLAHVVEAGLAEADLGYEAVEKAMEDAATEQAARLFRKIEYLQVIGTLAPMLGLLGTVWGMILAFLEFESKANPQVAELAPGIYRALVTTLMGLGVAVPALAAYAIFRNRIDELAAEATLMAEQVFAEYKRAVAKRRLARRAPDAGHAAASQVSRAAERG